MDRHKYVIKAQHGLTELSTSERHAAYSRNVFAYTESNFVNIDTLFLVIDALLFANLVDFADKNPEFVRKSYEQIYKDVRHCVDLCHRDGVIKNAVMQNPSRYIEYDPGFVPMVQRLKDAGKKVLLIEYVIVNFSDAFCVHICAYTCTCVSGLNFTDDGPP